MLWRRKAVGYPEHSLQDSETLGIAPDLAPQSIEGCLERLYLLLQAGRPGLRCGCSGGFRLAVGVLVRRPFARGKRRRTGLLGQRRAAFTTKSVVLRGLVAAVSAIQCCFCPGRSSRVKYRARPIYYTKRDCPA